MKTNEPAGGPASRTGVGPLLRHWRTTRRLSQLALALEAGSSARHMSYVETGRARPSRDMVLRLAEVLDVPLRDRNALLLAAGFAPVYDNVPLTDPEMARVREAIELILRHQEPYPAFVLDRHWSIRSTNRAAERCTRFLFDGDPAETNIVRILLHPEGLRPLMPEWEQTARELVRHLRRQIAATPSDEGAAALLEEVLGYPDVPTHQPMAGADEHASPVLTTTFHKDGVELRFFSTFTTFASPRDVALEELRIECSFPADEGTARACRELFGS